MNQDVINKQPEIVHNFRRCHMRGCMDMGWWYPVISLSPDGLQRAYVPFPHWLMCDHHKEYIELGDLIDGPLGDGGMAWTRIQSVFRKAGRVLPQREYTNLQWREA